jgi:hypothetical protein
VAWFLLLPLTFRIGRKVEGTGRPGRRCKQPLDELKEMRSFQNLKEEALGCTGSRNSFGRLYRLVGQTAWLWLWVSLSKCCKLLTTIRKVLLQDLVWEIYYPDHQPVLSPYCFNMKYIEYHSSVLSWVQTDQSFSELTSSPRSDACNSIQGKGGFDQLIVF